MITENMTEEQKTIERHLMITKLPKYLQTLLSIYHENSNDSEHDWYFTSMKTLKEHCFEIIKNSGNDLDDRVKIPKK